MDLARDAAIRTAAFRWLTDQFARTGSDVFPYSLLLQGFTFEGARVPMLGPQGIFKPRIMEEAPLSITTVPGGPYDDGVSSDGTIQYRYRGTDPDHPDNVGLRTAMGLQLPLVYFIRIATGKYMAVWPAFVVGDDPLSLTVMISIDDEAHAAVPRVTGEVSSDSVTVARREYVTSLVRVRLHQRSFRERVLDAYRRQCAFCRLRHEELLEAAHIVEDSDPRGIPAVQNGLALCALHHTAFDRLFIGLRPDYVIEVRRDILDEADGPTLAHAIQGLHGRPLILPRTQDQQPDKALVEMKYERFLQAS